MPYIHWEAYVAQRNVSRTIEEVKQESLKANASFKNKLPLWPVERVVNNTPLSFHFTHPNDKTKPKPKSPELDHISLSHPEAEEDYSEMIRRYLYKRRPVHLRRTLDQYYYSHLADTQFRDGDQVVMREFNDEQKRLKLETDQEYKALVTEQSELSNGFVNREPSAKRRIWAGVLEKLGLGNRRKRLNQLKSLLAKVDQQNYYDDNSPVLMIDQLWVWIIDKSRWRIILVRY